MGLVGRVTTGWYLGTEEIQPPNDMVEIKVLCPCGTKFKFDTEPVDRRIAAPVQCPSCGEDATALANAQLATLQPAQPVKTGLSIARPVPVVQAAPAPAVSEEGLEPLKSASPRKSSLRPAVTLPSTEPSLPLAITGALVGGLLGMLIWYGVLRYTGISVGWIAWGVGAATGLGAKLFGRGGNTAFAAVAAITALVAILGGKYLAISHRLDNEIVKVLSGAYDERYALAKAVENVASDDDMRAVLLKQAEKEGEKMEADDITAEDVAEFRKDELPELKDLLSGKLDRAGFEKRLVSRVKETIPFSVLMKASFTWLTPIWILLGLGSAWKIASGEE